MSNFLLFALLQTLIQKLSLCISLLVFAMQWTIQCAHCSSNEVHVSCKKKNPKLDCNVILETRVNSLCLFQQVYLSHLQYRWDKSLDSFMNSKHTYIRTSGPVRLMCANEWKHFLGGLGLADPPTKVGIFFSQKKYWICHLSATSALDLHYL